MEKRSTKRITDSLEAEIRSGDVNYSGIIMNFSEKGLYMVTATLYDVDEIPEHSLLDLKCHLPTGDTVNMNCEVKWFQTKPSPFGVSFSIGMEILDPPMKYRKFLKEFQ